MSANEANSPPGGSTGWSHRAFETRTDAFRRSRRPRQPFIPVIRQKMGRLVAETAMNTSR